jgi:hypothetical protein
MVLRDAERLEGMLNSEADRPNKKKHITECTKLQGERWFWVRFRVQRSRFKVKGSRGGVRGNVKSRSKF